MPTDVVMIIQARMGSSRLPGKVLAGIQGKPMLERVIRRTGQASTVDTLAVATSRAPADDAIVELCGALGIPCVRGSEDDVLDRYRAAADRFDADVVVRVTADCPLHDPAVVDAVVTAFLQQPADYVSNTLRCTFPDGLDTEVIARSALEQAWEHATLPSEREHVTPFIWKRPDRFRLRNVEADHDCSHLRWTVDEPADLEWVRSVYALIPEGTLGWERLLERLKAERHPLQSPASSARNDGYARSISQDPTEGRP